MRGNLSFLLAIRYSVFYCFALIRGDKSFKSNEYGVYSDIRIHIYLRHENTKVNNLVLIATPKSIVMEGVIAPRTVTDFSIL